MKNLVNKYGMLIVLIVLFIFFAFSSSAFLAPDNLINIARQIAMMGIAAVGVTFVILTGGMDLSVGSVLALSGIASAISMVNFKVDPVIAVVIGLLTGILIGLFNGIVVTRVKIPPFITTLATMQIFRGVCFILTGGLPVYGFPESFDFLGKGYILKIPVPVIIMIVLFAIGWIVINKTRYGRHLYAIGGNIESARLSGVNVKRELVLTYAISGFFAAIAGVLCSREFLLDNLIWAMTLDLM
jgi:ribose transport system permease protein